jgi:hypothetical protein
MLRELGVRGLLIARCGGLLIALCEGGSGEGDRGKHRKESAFHDNPSSAERSLV